MYIFESYLWQTVGIHLATLVPVTMIIPVQSWNMIHSIFFLSETHKMQVKLSRWVYFWTDVIKETKDEAKVSLFKTKLSQSPSSISKMNSLTCAFSVPVL